MGCVLSQLSNFASNRNAALPLVHNAPQPPGATHRDTPTTGVVREGGGALNYTSCTRAALGLH